MASTHLSTLSLNEHKRDELITLIERSFEYPANEKFAVDFYPLMKKENAHNNWLLIEDESEKILGHVGVLPRQLIFKNHSFNILLLGGIAIDKTRRGEGLLRKILDDVMKSYESNTALFILWSDKQELYKKFGFELFGGQRIYHLQTKPALSPTDIKTLTEEDRARILFLYKHHLEQNFLTIKRDPDHLDELLFVTSSNLFLYKEENKIEGYAFIGKGHDLQNVVHEIAIDPSKQQNFLSSLPAKVLWYPEYPILKNLEEEALSFMGAGKIGNSKLFQDMIELMTKKKIHIDKIIDSEILFTFNDSSYSLTHSDFLSGLFGPTGIKEFDGLIPSIYIPGLDSI